MATPKPHVALVSSPGIGHLIPVIELGKRLLSHHNFIVTIFTMAPQKSPQATEIMESATKTHPKLNIIELPSVDISNLVSPQTQLANKILIMMREAKPALRSAIAGMELLPDVLIVDMFGTESFEIADEFGLLKYAYVPCSAWAVSLLVYASTLDEVNVSEPVKIPGCKPVEPDNLTESVRNRSSGAAGEPSVWGELLKSDGILVNTWEDLEPVTLKAMSGEGELGRIIKKPVYAVGPIVRQPDKLSDSRSDLAGWLDKQPKGSVVYVSFGSGGTLSLEQTTELAWGLERSGQRFIWLARPPTASSSSASYLKMDKTRDDPSDFLPEEFLTRIKNRGLVISSWAQQVEIFAHRAIGGFLSHCGWNSSLESLVHGKPIIAWPLFAEQKLNAALLSEELRVAVRPKEWPSKGIIKREEIEEMARKVMVGRERDVMSKKAEAMKESAEEALKKPGGSSYLSLSQLAKQCEKWKLQK